MGIKNFSKLLNDYAPNLIKELDISTYKNKYIAVDTSLILYKYISGIRNSGKDITVNNKSVSHIFAIINKTINLLEEDIIPIYVFDGKAPEIKNKTLINRRKVKENAKNNQELSKTKEDKIKYFKRSLYITTEQYNECKEILTIMGIPYIQAEGEADCVCAQLIKKNLVYSVYSEDMDMLTFGCTKLSKKIIFKKNKKLINEIDLNELLCKLQLDYDQFINLCVLLGCDYINNIKGIGYKTSYKIIREYKSISNFIEKNKKYTIPINYNYKNIIEYYKNPPKTKLNSNYKIKKPNLNKLNKILIENKFSKKNINKIIYILTHASI
tara:strand:+ start:1011 stop:1985 length:975 start_codon:yes stop_codon:yes gene_type:complete